MTIRVLLIFVFLLLISGSIALCSFGFKKKNKGLKGVGIAAVILSLLGFICVPMSVYTVDTGEVAVVKFLGQANNIREAGTYFDFWITNTIQKYVVEINDIRCTILYPGETLSSIAMKYDISKAKLLDFNETTSEEDLKEGDIIFLDKKKNKYQGAQDYYRVKDGDTLYGISQQFGIKIASLTKMNHKNLFSDLSVGEKLILK